MPNSGCVPLDDGMEKPAAKKLDSPGAKSVWSGVDSDQDLVSVVGTRNRVRSGASKSRLKVYIGILILITLGLLTACAFLLYSYIENMLSPKDICVTAECITAAAMILNSMDPSANPCDDFYQFACGNFDKEHPIPETDFNEDWFTNRNHFSIRTVREYLEQNDTDDEPRPVHQARIMFRACKDIDSLQKVSLSPMMRFLEHLGLPRKPPLGAGDATISWQEAVAHIKRHIDKDIFIGFDVMADPVNNTVNRISVGMPSDSSPLPSHNEHSKIKRPPLRRLLARGGARGKIAWKDYIVKTLNYILEYNNQSSKALNSTVQEAAKKIIDFEAKLINLKENFTSTDPTRDDLPKNMWVTELQKITDKAVTTSQINWRKYIEVLFEGIDELDVNLDDYDKLAVYSVDYLKALMKLLAKTPPSTIFLTVWWEVVFELAPHTTNYMRDLRTDFEEKTIGEVAPASRPTHCAYVVYKLLDVAVGTAKTTESFLYMTKPKVNKMIDDIQDSFIKSVDKTSWIDKTTKIEIKEKVGHIRRRIGFPEWMLDKEEVEDYYDTLEMYEKTHLENVLTFLGRSVYSSFSTLHTYNMNNNTGFNPLEVNAAYSVQDNMIFVPLGMIQFPFYHLGIDALNYGAIGSILGHELVHALDTDGRRYDRYGNYRSWWTNDSISAFNQKVSCLVDKYSNYYIEEVDEWVDGNLTLGENIADNGGLRAALWGYHKRVSRQGSEPRLPGLQQYNHDQLFYLAFANIWCENWSKQAMRWTLEGEHAPNYVRVMGTLSNSPEFGRTWKCPANSEMNPQHKCHVW
ncbi:neprilysin-2-like [Macrosteles quadrilineatus]|uniref:neprilysin-2-like n=1 Tax=Macrosteles quadrilineatus TaxID=74068 RepID=UPI0023E20420|nr:neprilysin-2-like [Macrosteles quadrilineatus]